MTDDATPSGSGRPNAAGDSPDATDAAALRQKPRAQAPEGEAPYFAPGQGYGGSQGQNYPQEYVDPQYAGQQYPQQYPDPAQGYPQQYPDPAQGYPRQYPDPAQAYPQHYPDQQYADPAQYSDQQYPDQQYPDQQYPDQGYTDQGYPQQAHAGQQYPGQPQYPDQQQYAAGQQYADQQQYADPQQQYGQYLAQGYPGQQYADRHGYDYGAGQHPGQQYPAQTYPAQQFAGDPYGGQQPPARRNVLTIVAGVVVGLAVLSVLAVIAVVALRGSGGGKGEDDVAVSTTSPAASSGTTSPSASASVPPASSPAKATTPPATSSNGSIRSSVALSKGDCIKTLPKGQTIKDVTLVACTVPHAAQVGTTFSPGGSAYPGPKKFETLIAAECPARLQKVIRKDAPALSWTGYYPELVEWASGDHSIKCLLLAQNGKPLSKSVIN